MAKKNKPLDIENLKINFKLQYIGILIGFGIAIGVNVATFNNMKNKLVYLTDLSEKLDNKLDDRFSAQKDQFDNKLTDIQKELSEMVGKVDVITTNYQSNK